MPLVPAICTQCGAQIEVDDTHEAGVCKHCGTAFITEKAINNFIVKNESSVSLARLIQNIDTLVELKSWERAEEACEGVIRNYPEDYRGWWRKIVIESCNFSTNYISSRMRENYAIAYRLANERNRELIKLTFEKYEHQCKENDNRIKNEKKKGVDNAEYCNRYPTSTVREVLRVYVHYEYEDVYSEKKYFFDKFTFILGNTVKYRMYCNSVKVDRNDKLQKVKQYRDFETTCVIKVDNNIEELFSGRKTEDEGNCYIATCIYGSYDCPQVWTLRRFRDYTLDETWYGRVFIKCYYAISPTLVKWFGNQKWFRTFWKNRLDSMISNLNQKGVENTQYHDKY